MAKKRTITSRHKSLCSEPHSHSVQVDLFQAAEEAAQDKTPPPQSLRLLGLAIQMKAEDSLETFPDGRIQIISASGETQDFHEEPNEIKIKLSISSYLQNTRALPRETCNGIIRLLEASLKTICERPTKLTHANFISILDGVIKADRERELVDIGTALYPNYNAPEIRKRQLQDSLHIRQLKFIKMDNVMSDILPAICSNLRADANLHSWLREGLVTETGYTAFKDELIERNQRIRNEVEDTVGSGLPSGHPSIVTPENRGRRIYRQCQEVKDVKLNGHEPPKGFIRGAYENLADDAKNCRIFWHPNGERHFFPDRSTIGEDF